MKIQHCSLSSYLLLLLAFTASAQLVRIPINKISKQEPDSKTHLRNLNSESPSVNIHNIANFIYTGNIKLGTRQETFKVVLDTGSANLWVRDSSLSNSPYSTYDCPSSATCQSFPQSRHRLSYGRGDIEGYKVVEQVQIGDLKVQHFSMILAYQAENFPNTNIDGILGLSLGRHIHGFPTLLQTLKGNALIDSASFSIYLGDDPNSSGGTTGEIIFGGYDPNYADGEFKFVNVHSSYETLFWAAPLKSISYGLKHLMHSRQFSAIFDSGTSLIVMPESLIRDIVESADHLADFYYDSSTEFYQCECSARYTLADLTFELNGVNLTVPASSYIIPRSGSCYLGLQSSERFGHASQIILGDAVLKHYYTFYNADNFTVGFAPAAPMRLDPTLRLFLILLLVGTLIILVIYVWNQRKKKVSQSLFNQMRSRGVTIGGGYTELQPQQEQRKQDRTCSEKSDVDKGKDGESETTQSHFAKLKSKGLVIGSDYESTDAIFRDDAKIDAQEKLEKS